MEIRGVYDGVLYEVCPACGFAWHTWPQDSPRYSYAEKKVREHNERRTVAQLDSVHRPEGG